MAKTLRTSGDYTIKTGTGFTGNNSVILDSKTTRIKGDLIIDGDQVVVNTETLSIEDPMIVLSRNTSSTVLDEWDSGILVNRGAGTNNATFYWDGADDVWKAMLTTSTGSGTEITETQLARIRANDPSDNQDVATKNYVDTELGSISGSSFTFVGDDSTGTTLDAGETLKIAGGDNISSVVAEPDTITISLDRDLNGIDTISTDRSNQNLTLTANGTGEIVIDPVLTFTLGSANPTATTSTKVYNKTAGGGGTGLYFKNTNIDSGTEGELISKKKATALAIALG